MKKIKNIIESINKKTVIDVILNISIAWMYILVFIIYSTVALVAFKASSNLAEKFTSVFGWSVANVVYLFVLKIMLL